METVHTFQHDDYYCNSWMVKCKYFNGYLFAPTCYGKLFIWNLHTKQLCAILNDHSEHAYIRNTIAINNSNNNGFYLFTSGDDSITNVYETTSTMNNNLSTRSLDKVYKSNNSSGMNNASSNNKNDDDDSSGASSDNDQQQVNKTVSKKVPLKKERRNEKSIKQA